ncbi:MAG: hypothetical protein ACPLRA_00090 [Candidatus Saccharicenans sp.]
MEKKFKSIFTMIFLLSVLVSEAFSIPAFARKYSISCKVCHTPFPKLKPYGDDFMNNGYVIKDKDTPRYNIDTGDNLLSLLRELPIAIRFEGFISLNNSNNKKLDFAAPFLIKLLSGGEITKHLSYYFYFFFTEKGEVAGLEDAFIMVNNLFNKELDVYVGQFQVSDPLFKRELRLMYEDYKIYSTKVGQAHADLTYDRGLMFTYSFNHGPDLCFEIINGLGLRPADDFDTFDYDKFKNFMLRVSQSLSPAVRLGGFGYLGRERQGNVDDKLWMLGADLSWSSPKFEVNLQYLERQDNNPEFLIFEPTKVRTRGGFAEFIYLPKADDSRWYSTALFNWVDSDQPDLKYISLGLHYGYLLRRNMRLTIEGTYVFKSDLSKYFRLGLGLITAY